MLIKLSSPFFPPLLLEFTLLFVQEDNINFEYVGSRITIQNLDNLTNQPSKIIILEKGEFDLSGTTAPYVITSIIIFPIERGHKHLNTFLEKTRPGAQQCQAQGLVFYFVLHQVRVRDLRTELVCKTNKSKFLDGSRALFLVPGYSPSKSQG